MAADRRESNRLALELFDTEEATAAAAAKAAAAAPSQGSAGVLLNASAGPAALQARARPSTIEMLKRTASDTLVRGLSARVLLTLKSQAREQDPTLVSPGDSAAPRADGGARAPAIEADLAALRKELAELREQLSALPAAVAAALQGGGGSSG